MDYTKLKIGTKIYYTGDMANPEGRGKIVRITHSFYPVEYWIKLTDGRLWEKVLPSNFKGIGRRFWVEKEYEAERKNYKRVKND